MEKWKPAFEFEDQYEVSTHGNVRKIGDTTNKVIRITPSSGVVTTKMWSKKHNKALYVNIAQLVLRTFVGDSPPSPYAGTKHKRAKVIHKDGNLLNVHVDNLMWKDTHQAKQVLIEMYKRGCSHAEMAERIGVTSCTVHAMLRDVPTSIMDVGPDKQWDDEEWRPLKGFKNIIDGYLVSNYGRVYSSVGTNVKGRKVRPKYMAATKVNGYDHFRLLNTDLTATHCLGHQLVMHVFAEPDPTRPFVDHIDRNRSNNHISNLRWCTNDENMLYASKYYEYNDEVVRLVKVPHTDVYIARKLGISAKTVARIRQNNGLKSVHWRNTNEHS